MGRRGWEGGGRGGTRRRRGREVKRGTRGREGRDKGEEREEGGEGQGGEGEHLEYLYPCRSALGHSKRNTAAWRVDEGHQTHKTQLPQKHIWLMMREEGDEGVERDEGVGGCKATNIGWVS